MCVDIKTRCLLIRPLDILSYMSGDEREERKLLYLRKRPCFMLLYL